MVTETSSDPALDIERRARVLATLADPARLAVVDALVLGDTSPGELGARLGMSSNLLAHHLGVLEREAVVARHRSQADRRRSYVRLVPGALDGLVPGMGAGTTSTRHSEVTRVVFVCTANSARSVLAASLWSRTSAIPVEAGGTHPAPAIAPGARAAARRHRLRLGQAAPRLVPELQEDDFVVTVCDNAYEDLRGTSALDAPRRRVHWSIPDPVSVGTEEAFENALADLEGRVVTLADHLTSTTNTEPPRRLARRSR